MKEDACQKEIKAIKLLQDRSVQINNEHLQIEKDLVSIKEWLAQCGGDEITQSPEYVEQKQEYLASMVCEQDSTSVDLAKIYSEADLLYKDQLGLNDILSATDWKAVEHKLDRHIQDFNRRYGLDGWDYAIAGSCGLFAAMLDLFFVKAPLKPTVKWHQEVDGTFNQWVQKAFNEIIPPELSAILSKGNPIGSADSSVISDLIEVSENVLSPSNHRLRSLSHDPILGFLFGVFDMVNNTCTVVFNGEITSFPSKKPPIDGTIFQLLGRMLGHLLSDVNAPTAKGNRGMGLPAPFMGILRMFEGIPINDSNFGKQIEWMYVKGYDFRQFVVSSVPMAIMEVMLRSFYVIKQMKLYGVSFGEALLETMPVKMNPRFRIMLALSYGTSSSVNAGKMYITQNILNANYASWMGFAWNGFHSLKWALLDRNLKLWEEIENKEIEELENIINDLDQLSTRASQLPT